MENELDWLWEGWEEPSGQCPVQNLAPRATAAQAQQMYRMFLNNGCVY